MCGVRYYQEQSRTLLKPDPRSDPRLEVQYVRIGVLSEIWSRFRSWNPAGFFVFLWWYYSVSCMHESQFPCRRLYSRWLSSSLGMHMVTGTGMPYRRSSPATRLQTLVADWVGTSGYAHFKPFAWYWMKGTRTLPAWEIIVEWWISHQSGSGLCVCSGGTAQEYCKPNFKCQDCIAYKFQLLSSSFILRSLHIHLRHQMMYIEEK